MILYLYTLWNDHRKSSYHVLPCMYARQVTSGVSYPLPLWAVALQVPLSMGFPRQEYWSGLPFPTPGDLRDSGIKPTTSLALAGGFFTTEPPGKPHKYKFTYIKRERFMLRTWLPQLWRFGKCKLLRVGWQAGNPGEACSLSPKAFCWQNCSLLRGGQSLFY